MKRWIGQGILIAVMMTASFSYGMLSQKYHWPPYGLFQAAYRYVSPKPTPKRFTTIPSQYLETDAGQLIEIDTAEDAAARRERLITLLWGEPHLPAFLPAGMVENFEDEAYEDVPQLKRIDKLIVKMDFGLESYVYHLFPAAPNHDVVLYHEGHVEDSFASRRQIAELLENGYSVVTFCMPLRGRNNRPLVDLPRMGRLKLTFHDQMKFLAPGQGHSIKYFFEPVVAALNYLEKHYDYRAVSMVGISGGGWTTTLAAAMDPRIGKSFPVAGSYPIYLRSRRDWGDWEQTEPTLYNTVNYLEMYVLGAHGEGRKQLQIINKEDPCCFAGLKWQTYRDAVRSRVQELGQGEFDVFLDESHQHHDVSDEALKQILLELQQTE